MPDTTTTTYTPLDDEVDVLLRLGNRREALKNATQENSQRLRQAIRAIVRGANLDDSKIWELVMPTDDTPLMLQKTADNAQSRPPRTIRLTAPKATLTITGQVPAVKTA
jgi:hypothetical protein